MFITRATRHDKADFEEFFKAHDWDDSHLDKGTAFIARDGGIVGSVRLIEVEPNLVIIEDVLVRRDRRGAGIGAQVMRAAMNSRGGKLFLCCHPERTAFYQRLDFSEVPFDAMPESVKSFFIEDHAAPHQLSEGHVHHYMTAR
jgi:N-acetylglutamate synthase-like GNAT family acetyltransferase